MRHLTSILCADCTVGKLGICASLDEATLSETARFATTYEFKKSERIWFGDNADPAALIVRKGCVTIVLELSDGRQQILDLLTQGDILLDIDSDNTLGLYARAATDAEVCRIPEKTMDHLYQRSPNVAQSIMKAMLNELLRKNTQLAMLGQKRSEERIAALVLDLAQRSGVQGTPKDRVHLPLSRGEIGDMLCLTKETVSRSFTFLRDEKLIATPRPSEVIIVDRTGLEALAGWAKRVDSSR